jgi:hypothetical protein
MAACAMLSYNGVSPEAWQTIQNATSQYGISVETDSGTAAKEGFTITWNYERQAGNLSIQCINSPWFINCSTINSHINDAVEACLKQNNIEMADMIGHS